MDYTPAVRREFTAEERKFHLEQGRLAARGVRWSFVAVSALVAPLLTLGHGNSSTKWQSAQRVVCTPETTAERPEGGTVGNCGARFEIRSPK